MTSVTPAPAAEGAQYCTCGGEERAQLEGNWGSTGGSGGKQTSGCGQELLNAPIPRCEICLSICRSKAVTPPRTHVGAARVQSQLHARAVLANNALGITHEHILTMAVAMETRTLPNNQNLRKLPTAGPNLASTSSASAAPVILPVKVV